MAGSGRRVFTPGEVLTASNVMNYLQDQVVQTYAGTAARGSAIGTAVAEGMVSYLADNNAVEIYDGSDWKTLGKTTGGILQVVTATDTTTRTTTSTSYISASLSANIVPTKVGNLIIAIWNFRAEVSGNDADGFGFYKITEGGTSLVGAQEATLRVRRGAITPGEVAGTLNVIGSYTAVGTASVTIQCEFRNGFSGVTTSLNNATNNGRLFLIEVSA